MLGFSRSHGGRSWTSASTSTQTPGGPVRKTGKGPNEPILATTAKWELGLGSWVVGAEDGPSSGGSRQAVGQAHGGRYLRVIYVPDEVGDSVFVVTAYPLAGRELKAYRRRKKRRGR
jgi:hypothetical protein